VVREEVLYPDEPAAAWQRLVRPQDWWSAEHSYSHDAGNLSLTLEPGGCWCERLGAGGALSLTLRREPTGGTRVVAEYAVSGYAPAGLDQLAGAVDQVLGAQLARFAAPP
jgi:hypothetical protein